MVGRMRKMACVLCAVILAGASDARADEDNVEKRRFVNCSLIHDADGEVRVRKPMVYFGMWGVMSGHPDYRLSPALARELAPLIMVPAPPPARDESKPLPPGVRVQSHPGFFMGGLPESADPKKPSVVLTFRARVRLIGTEPEDVFEKKLYEIESIEIEYAEFVPRAWRDAAGGLTSEFWELFREARKEKSEVKLKALPDDVVRDLQTLQRIEVRDEYRAILKQTAPEARLITSLQHRVADHGRETFNGLAERLGVSPMSQPSAEASHDSVQNRRLDSCFIYATTDGELWVAKPIAVLGMWAPSANIPRFRLSPDVAAQLSPLVSPLARDFDKPIYHHFRYPQLRGDDGVLYLLDLETRVRVVDREQVKPPNSNLPGFERGTLELVSAKIASVEPVPATWIAGWMSLDEALKEIVKVSITAPTPQKRERLAEQMEKASLALHHMAEAELAPGERQDLSEFVHRPKLVSVARRATMRTWRKPLERAIKATGVQPARALPPWPEEMPPAVVLRRDLWELVLASESAADAVTRFKAKWPAQHLDHEVGYLREAGGTVNVSKLNELTAEQFRTIHEQAKGNLENLDKWLDKRRERIRSGWGIEVETANPDTLNSLMLIRGTRVARIDDASRNPGFAVGDVIVDYDKVYNLVMESYGAMNPIGDLSSMVGDVLSIPVIRGEKLITIQGRKAK